MPDKCKPIKKLTRRQLVWFNRLNPKQKIFMNNILAGMEKGDACKNAGYSFRKGQRLSDKANEILGSKSIQNFLDSLESTSCSNEDFTKNDLTKILVDIATANIIDYIEVDEESDSIKLRDIHKLSRNHGEAIKTIRQTRHGVEITLFDKLNATRQLADILGYNAPKEVNNNNKNENVDLTPDQAKLIDENFDAQY